MQVLKGCKMLAMSVCSMGRIPGGYITNHMYSWVDPQGQSVSPPPDSQEAIQRKGHSMEERTVRTMCVCMCMVVVVGGVISLCLSVCELYHSFWGSQFIFPWTGGGGTVILTAESIIAASM